MIKRILCKCWWRRLYFTLYKLIMLPVRRIAGGIQIIDQLVATLYDENGNVIRRIVGPKMHNKWHDNGLDSIANCIRLGCSAAPGLKAEYMRLGSQCSDTNFTYIDPSQQTTLNTSPGVKQVRFFSDWPATPAINGICQVQLLTRSYTGSGNIGAALYNFGVTFNKASGVTLEIEWTTTLSS